MGTQQSFASLSHFRYKSHTIYDQNVLKLHGWIVVRVRHGELQKLRPRNQAQGKGESENIEDLPWRRRMPTPRTLDQRCNTQREAKRSVSITRYDYVACPSTVWCTEARDLDLEAKLYMNEQKCTRWRDKKRYQWTPTLDWYTTMLLLPRRTRRQSWKCWNAWLQTQPHLLLTLPCVTEYTCQ